MTSNLQSYILVMKMMIWVKYTKEMYFLVKRYIYHLISCIHAYTLMKFNLDLALISYDKLRASWIERVELGGVFLVG